MIRYSKRQNLVVFGIAESSAYATPEALAAHVQSLLFGHVPSSAAPLVSCTYRLGKWKASSRLRAKRIRLDEDLTKQQMQQRKGQSSDFLGLKIRGFKPFFQGYHPEVQGWWSGAPVCQGRG
ncbi:TPA: hypothetical protein ACH3X2_010905 [Trebouxia sp. C0005]